MGRLSPAFITSEQLPAEAATRSGQCDAACPAEALLWVIRSTSQELAFCQHHFREHALALMADGWSWAVMT